MIIILKLIFTFFQYLLEFTKNDSIIDFTKYNLSHNFIYEERLVYEVI